MTDRYTYHHHPYTHFCNDFHHHDTARAQCASIQNTLFCYIEISTCFASTVFPPVFSRAAVKREAISWISSGLGVLKFLLFKMNSISSACRTEAGIHNVVRIGDVRTRKNIMLSGLGSGQGNGSCPGGCRSIVESTIISWRAQWKSQKVVGCKAEVIIESCEPQARKGWRASLF